MKELAIRCSSLGLLMTEPKLKSEVLSVGAKTYLRQLAAEAIFGIDFVVSSKEMEKGILVEQDAIDMLNRVRGLSLTKNTERRSNGLITGECDLFNAPVRRGHDIKCSWSAKTFPIAAEDCVDKVYEFQMRGYMALWDAGEWSVDYCLVNTPEKLIGFDPLTLHIVDHIPEHMRVTSWVVTRDADKEAAIWEKVKHARAYYQEVIETFDRTHQVPMLEAA
jgi:hypothetical protein